MSIPTGTKFIGISPNVDTLERKSNQANSPSQIYTIEDIAESSRLYKIYTALLTQSGDSDSPYFLQAGALNIGNTYMIYQESPGMDFTNIGAPNNNLNTYFVATGTTPNSWGSNEGSDILYSNNGWPTVNILENTIGTLAFVRQTTGYYSIVSQDYLFTVNKTWYNITPGELITSDLYQEMVYGNTTEILMYTSAGGTLADGILNKTPIEIRVYN